jgi:hypothetical protein
MKSLRTEKDSFKANVWKSCMFNRHFWYNDVLQYVTIIFMFDTNCTCHRVIFPLKSFIAFVTLDRGNACWKYISTATEDFRFWIVCALLLNFTCDIFHSLLNNAF